MYFTSFTLKPSIYFFKYPFCEISIKIFIHFFNLHAFRYFIPDLTYEINLQLYPWFLVCTEGLQTLLAYLYLLFFFTFYTDLVSGLREHSFLLQNPSPNCQVRAACKRHCFQPTSLCLTPSSHIKIMGYGQAHGLLHCSPQLPLTAPWLVRWTIFHQLM